MPFPSQAEKPVQNRDKNSTETQEIVQAQIQNTGSEKRTVVAVHEDIQVLGQIKESVKLQLPMELRLFLQDSSKFQMRLSDSVLYLEVIPGFYFDRFRKNEILMTFEAAAEKATGRKIHAQLQELKPKSGPVRDINELKQFKEVKFI